MTYSLVICGILFVMLMFRLQTWRSRLTVMGNVILGACAAEVVLFALTMMFVPIGPILLDAVPWFVAFALGYFILSPPRDVPSTMHAFVCEQCGAGVAADALRCSNCPAVFSEGSRWRIVRRGR